jgi:hypothetical protein
VADVSKAAPPRRRDVAAARRQRELPYSVEHQASRHRSWDARRRKPRDLRHAVRLVRAAWIAETPVQLHERVVGDDGNPRLTSEAWRFVFGSPELVEAPDPSDRVAFRSTPFRATLAAFRRGDEKQRAQAEIIHAVTAGEQTPGEAAAAQGVPWWCAKDVAEAALRAFLAQMTDVVVVGD